MKKIVFLLLLFNAFIVSAQEICDNAIDDDLDGLIDLNDPDCDCVELSESSLIPNPSFEELLCCPETLGALSCAEDWVQASIPTTDFFNLCGIESFPGFTPPELPLPGEPGGEGYVGFWAYDVGWSEYVGACIDEPMLAGTSYILNLWVAHGQGPDTLDLTIYGTPNCADLPWGGTTCPDGIDGWETLGHTLVDMELDGIWEEVTIEFTPAFDVEAISIGGPCYSGAEFPRPYYYVDELTLLDSISFYGISKTGGWCSGDLVLSGNTDFVGGDWQWYKEGIALIGETNQELNVMPYGEGDYSVVYRIAEYCERSNYSTSTALEAAFSVDGFCFPGTAEFVNETVYDLDETVTWQWDFGDGDSDIEEEPSHLYAVSGTYPVSLVAVSEDESCNDTLIVPLFIAPTPTAAFDFTSAGIFTWAGHEVICAGTDVDFTDLSTVDAPSTIVNWTWYFGDGVTSAEAEPSHPYADFGIFDISLVVETEAGCTDSVAYEELYVTAISPDFTVENECVFDEFNFVNTSTVIAPSTFDTWEWNFGDGETGITEDADHIYSEAGTYTVELIATTVSGCTDTVESVIEVFPAPTPAFEFVVDGLSSEDGGTGGCFTSVVQFNDLSSIDLPYEITGWEWDFGDGGTDIVQNPSHEYAMEGTYTVELTISSNEGCSSVIAMDILMTNGIAYLSSDTTICQNGTAVLTAASSDGSFHTYNWSIPGADEGAVQTIDDLVAPYWVYVSSTNEQGCISPLDSVLITVLDPITLDITPFDTVCIGENSGATVSVSGGRSDYTYNWTADGIPLPDNMPTIVTTPFFTTTYCVTVADGCETDPVSICTETYVPEVVSFTSDTTEGCEPTEITFTDLTGPNTALNQSTWFINGEVLTGNPVNYTFEEAGDYSVTLDVLSPEGCVTTGAAISYITIHPLPEPRFYITPNPTTYFNTTVEVVNINPNINSSFFWELPGGFPETAASDSLVEVTYPELVSGNYTVNLIETTQYGCVDSVQLSMIINNDQLIYVPNTFTPDGNGVNETWGIHIAGIDVYNFHLTVFNRWGEMVWESYDPTGTWDGRYGGDVVQDGVYVWVIQANDKENDKIYEFKGTVNVLR